MAQFPDPTFRTATEQDVPRLLEVHFAAYPGPYPVELRKRNFLANPFGPIEDLTVAEIDGDIVAHAFLFAFEASFGGRRTKVGGIASVAVAPEVRGRGVGRAIMKRVHALSDTRGDAVTLLYPFRQGFYGALGYAPMTSRRRLAFDPRAVPGGWLELARRSTVGRAKSEDRERIESLHAAAAARTNGWITRSTAFWDRLFARERRHHLVTDGGYVAFTIDQEHTHGEAVLLVDELVAVDDVARRTLYGALAAMRDQVHEIVVEIAHDDPLEHALVDVDRRRYGTETVEHALGEVVAGPMVRIEDVHRAIESRGYRDGELSFDVVVDDEIAMAVSLADGRATVAGARGGAVLRASRATLAGIFYGGLRATDAARLGLLDADARLLERIERIDEVIALPPLAPIDSF
jgi:predicted acetyltransferase